MMKTVQRAVGLVAGACLASTLAATAAEAQQGPYWSVTIGGQPFGCTDYMSQPVPIYFDRTIGDSAIARRFPDGTNFIAFNPDATNWMSPPALAFLFAHECVHHQAPFASETEVDCSAAWIIRRQGIITNHAQLAEALWPLASSPGSNMGHLPGPVRVAAIERCWSGAG